MNALHRSAPGSNRSLLALTLVGLGLVTSGCRQDMHDQPKYKSQGVSKFFADGRNQRPKVPNTVARGHLDEDDHYFRGKVDGKVAETFPMPVTAAMLSRGRERYSIYCQPCHSPAGDGNGMIVQRGMKRPPSYQDPRLMKSPPGYFFDVITNGFGAMYDYADRIPVEDRWAIVAYVQVLQASQNVALKDLPADERAQVAAAAKAAADDAAKSLMDGSNHSTSPAGGHK